MVDKLCRAYGPLVGYLNTENEDGESQIVAFYDFPTPEKLVGKDVESTLRELGFGYRAKYLHQTAVMVTEEREPGWLDSLRNPESVGKGDAGQLVEGGREGYRKAHEALLELQGVGPKVADCVCLMGLGWGEAVPVDTHGKLCLASSRLPLTLVSQYGRSHSGIISLAKASTAA